MGKLLGLVEMQQRVQMAHRALPRQIDAALKTEAEPIMSAAKEQSPVDTGVMRASGYVSDPETVGTTHRIEIGFGGASSDYVVIVHENLSARHPVGNAKFLEIPLRQAAPGLLGRIATRIAFDNS